MTNQAQLTTVNVEIRETDLFEVWCHALESGEWTQITDRLMGNGNERCVLGVGVEILRRANCMLWDDITDWKAFHPRIGEVTVRAAELLGEQSLAGANDAGNAFKLMAAALRRARIDVESWSEPPLSPIFVQAPLAVSPTYQAIIKTMRYQIVPEDASTFTFVVPTVERKFEHAGV